VTEPSIRTASSACTTKTRDKAQAASTTQPASPSSLSLAVPKSRPLVHPDVPLTRSAEGLVCCRGLQPRNI
jgi:hypothetical protein